MVSTNFEKFDLALFQAVQRAPCVNVNCMDAWWASSTGPAGTRLTYKSH